MLPQRGGRVLERALYSSASPRLAIPTLQTPRAQRHFSATPQVQSKLGRTPIRYPPEVEVNISEPRRIADPTTYKVIERRTATVKGPLGTQELEIPEFVHLEHDPKGREIKLSIENRDLQVQRAMWGTTWSYLRSHIIGVSEGHTAILRFVGVGYRAMVAERQGEAEPWWQIILKLGFTHHIPLRVPVGVKASAPQPTRLLLEGCNKEDVMSFAAEIRKWRKPEPYKGKGIFVNDETIKLKQKKIK